MRPTTKVMKQRLFEMSQAELLMDRHWFGEAVEAQFKYDQLVDLLFEFYDNLPPSISEPCPIDLPAKVRCGYNSARFLNDEIRKIATKDMVDSFNDSRGAA